MMVARRSSVVALEVGSIHAGSRQRERARPGDRHSNCSSSSESRIGLVAGRTCDRDAKPSGEAAAALAALLVG
jgi:hypothetical protein